MNVYKKVTSSCFVLVLLLSMMFQALEYATIADEGTLNGPISSLTLQTEGALVIDGTTVELFGNKTYTYVKITNSGTLIVAQKNATPGTGYLNIYARDYILIDSTSTIDAYGKGWEGGTALGVIGSDGSGPGGGQGSCSGGGSGGGGAGYGGNGGNGGASYDPTGPGGVGGLSYGLSGPLTSPPSFDDIQMGSGGGGSRYVATRPNGGGMIALKSDRIMLHGGSITANGKGDITGAGGGSGGGILIIGKDVWLDGRISANGGNGGDAAGGSMGGGGGSSGGRIKIFYETLNNDSIIITVTGGSGGFSCGPGSSGSDGQDGTIHYEQHLFVIDKPPLWQNQGQNASVVGPGDSNLLYAQGFDDFALEYAWLETNETGAWKNYMGKIQEISYNYSDTINNKAYQGSTVNACNFDFLNEYSEFTSTQYLAVASNDTNKASFNTGLLSHYPVHKFWIQINEDIDALRRLNIYWRGRDYGEGYGKALFVYENGTWIEKRADTGEETTVELSVVYDYDFSLIVNETGYIGIAVRTYMPEETYGEPYTYIQTEFVETVASRIISTYDSPQYLKRAQSSWVWSNFTWQNSSIPAGTTISWRIHYNDTSGLENATETMSFTISIVHDVAIVFAEVSGTQVYSGETVNITVTVRNEGTETETFNVTAYYNDTPIQKQVVNNLTRGSEIIVIFDWDTTGVPHGIDYTISVEASVVTGEVDTGDNFFEDSTVWVWKIEIVEVVPCDQSGNPKEIFEIGSIACFKVTLNNTGLGPQDVLITINIYDSNGATIGVASIQGPLSPGVSTFILCIPLPASANVGTATVYANAFTDWPHLGGVPYCSEMSATFQIVSP